MPPKMATKSKQTHEATGATKRPRDATPTTPERSPIKKRKMGITLQRKQTLIQNLQLEITERARRLRAQYHMQAQGLRSRIEIRINRIPMSLRKMKMNDLLQKCIDQEQAKTTASLKPPPVPAKDGPVRSGHAKPMADARRVMPAARGQKRMSDELAGDKENDFEYADNAKKRVRAAPGAASVRPAQVLSPTSSNSRLNRDRPASPIKGLARPGSPLKSAGTTRSAAATSILSSMVEKAKGARPATSRKVTTTASTAPATKGRKPTAAAAASSRPPTRAGRRVSATSEASDGSTATTVVKKATGARGAAAASTKKVMSTFRKGTASADTKKVAGTKTGAGATTTASGRVLRKRT
ncbi:Borealin-lik [Sarocladium implicatum]|nr:Borealin-lik [Sarocladium implicatum]